MSDFATNPLNESRLEFNKAIRNVCRSIEVAADYMAFDPQVKEYLKNKYSNLVDDPEDYKQYIMMYVKDCFYN